MIFTEKPINEFNLFRQFFDLTTSLTINNKLQNGY